MAEGLPEKELAILTSDAAKESLRRAQIELISYRNLVGACASEHRKYHHLWLQQST